MINIEQLFQDYHIVFATHGHKHTREGWIQVSCPFCTGSEGYHLGFSIEAQIFNCYRCGRHTKKETIKALLNISWRESTEIIQRYETDKTKNKYKSNKQYSAKPTQLPMEAKPLQQEHIEYLEKRNFNPQEIIDKWEILGTNHLGDYKKRIIIPIFYDGELASYQGRDITGKQLEKYKACRIPEEYVHHKDLLYGIDNVPHDKIIVCEGVMDVWRLGYGAVCTFGVRYTKKQLLSMMQFNEVAIMYDMDAPGITAAQNLSNELNLIGKKSFIIEYTGHDPDTASTGDLEEIKKWING